ncbi:TPA: hypothetical protein ACH0TE_000538 [Citrobacter farmeri]
MTTITRFTKEQLLKRLEEQMSSGRYALGFVQDSEILRDIEIDLRITEIALASLTADPVAGEARFKEEHHWSPCTAAHVAMVLANPSDWPNYEVRYLYTAPPAPESVPDEMTMADAIMEIDVKDADRWTGRIGFQKGWNACRAAMLQGGE